MVDSGQETVFGFLPRLKTFEYCLLEAGVLIIFKDHQMVDGSNPNLSFYSLNWGSIQFCFLSKIDICL